VIKFQVISLIKTGSKSKKIITMKHHNNNSSNNLKVKIMKNLSLSLIIAGLFISNGIFAQSTSFGVKGGFDLFKVTDKFSDGTNADTKMIPTFNLGVYADLPVAQAFFIRPELAYALRGTKYTDGNATIHVSYLELPVTFLYKAELAEGKLLVGLGPYSALGIAGKAKDINGTTSTIKFKNTVNESDYASDNFYVRPFDFGGRAYAGYELKNGLSFTLEATLGMTNLVPEVSGGTNDETVKLLGFGLNIGYKIK
jgi:hypothetical protein